MQKACVVLRTAIIGLTGRAIILRAQTRPPGVFTTIGQGLDLICKRRHISLPSYANDTKALDDRLILTSSAGQF
jgi:hypothetical protein